jgi:aspartyl-tRNA(Asn)/glutamyl-tRNA(Gln) amidotransferase subunit B
MKLINEDGKTIETIPYSTIDFISDMILMIKNNEINGKQAKQIIVEIYQKNISPQKIVSENGLAQITDKNVIKELYLKIFEQNPAMVEQCKVRPDRTEKFFIGMLMKETKGQANPQLANEVLRELMSNLN